MNNDYDIIIVGGGIVGASIAYHLGLLGRYSVCLLERDRLTSGTTWHAAGLVAELRQSANLTRLAKYSGELYESLDEQGRATGYRRVGALTLSLNPDRTIELKRLAAMATSFGVTCHWLSAAELGERWAHLDLTDVDGGVFMPRDGQTNPVDTTVALAGAAKAAGVEVRERAAVSRMLVEHGRVTGVMANGEPLRAAKVVLAAGLWSRGLAHAAGANVPLYPCEHYYAVTEGVALPAASPIVRVPDHGVYLKPDAGRMLIGSFERQAKPIDPDRLGDDFSFQELPFDLDHFAPYLAAALERVPLLKETGIRTWFNGPESFTPDGRYILGPSPDVAGLFVAAGFNSIGIQSAGGVGQVMARWIDEGAAPVDLWDVDIRRFQPHQNTRHYLEARVAESLGLLYAMHWPFQQFESARDQRRSPLHERLAQRGACFGELAGWERPNWYALPGQQPAYEYSYGRQNWFSNAASEHRSVRTDVALFDQSSFAKFQISGPDAMAFLNRLCTARMDVAVGQVVYCQCLNERGGIEADVTVTRTAEDTYLYVTAAPCAIRDGGWLRGHSSGYEVDIEDVTEVYAVLGVMGPGAREKLGSVTTADLSPAGFGFATSRSIDIAGVDVRATRITYVGALGWELYIPWAQAARVFDVIAAEVPTLAGYHAMDSLRIEKAYRHWGHDISDEDTPLEAGLSFTIAWDKAGGFIGQEALLEQRAGGLTKRLALFVPEDPEILLYHDEPILVDGRPAGLISSAAYGHSIGRAVGFGYLHAQAPFTLKSLVARRFEIQVGDVLCPAKVATRALYDPEQLEIR